MHCFIWLPDGPKSWALLSHFPEEPLGGNICTERGQSGFSQIETRRKDQGRVPGWPAPESPAHLHLLNERERHVCLIWTTL